MNVYLIYIYFHSCVVRHLCTVSNKHPRNTQWCLCANNFHICDPVTFWLCSWNLLSFTPQNDVPTDTTENNTIHINSHRCWSGNDHIALEFSVSVKWTAMLMGKPLRSCRLHTVHEVQLGSEERPWQQRFQFDCHPRCEFQLRLPCGTKRIEVLTW